ncbi:hypothetical protein DFH28DRAFT_1119770 [Melampsora americana]|nr:hypothetical protein DFH28DRAFT_1119770 [Melampsora americana]
MFNFPATTKSKNSGFLPDVRFSRTQPTNNINLTTLPSPPRLPLPQGLTLLSAGPESFLESVSRSCAFIGQVESPKMTTVSNSYNASRSIPASTSLPRSSSIRHTYTSSSSSNTSSSSSSSASSFSSQSSQMSSTSSLDSSSTSKSIRKERRKGALFTNIVITREDRAEDCFLYAASRLPSLPFERFSQLDSTKGPELPRNLSTVRMTRNNLPQVVSRDHTRHVSHRASICEGKVPPSPAFTVFSNEYEDDDEDDEEVLEDDESHYRPSRPSSSLSTRSDPFEYSAYLSQPTSRNVGRSLSRASSVTIRPTKRDSKALKTEPSSPSLVPSAPIPTPRIGPPEIVYEALRALKSIQSRESFLFNVEPEDVDDEIPSDLQWTTYDPSQVGIAL